MADGTIDKVLKADFPNLVYGQDYVNLGYKSGNEGVIKTIVTNLRELYSTDSRGTAVQSIPMMRALMGGRMYPLTLEGLDRAMRELVR